MMHGAEHAVHDYSRSEAVAQRVLLELRDGTYLRERMVLCLHLPQRGLLVLTENRLVLASAPSYKSHAHVPLATVQDVRERSDGLALELTLRSERRPAASAAERSERRTTAGCGGSSGGGSSVSGGGGGGGVGGGGGLGGSCKELPIAEGSESVGASIAPVSSDRGTRSSELGALDTLAEVSETARTASWTRVSTTDPASPRDQRSPRRSSLSRLLTPKRGSSSGATVATSGEAVAAAVAADTGERERGSVESVGTPQTPHRTTMRRSSEGSWRAWLKERRGSSSTPVGLGDGGGVSPGVPNPTTPGGAQPTTPGSASSFRLRSSAKRSSSIEELSAVGKYDKSATPQKGGGLGKRRFVALGRRVIGSSSERVGTVHRRRLEVVFADKETCRAARHALIHALSKRLHAHALSLQASTPHRKPATPGSQWGPSPHSSRRVSNETREQPNSNAKAPQTAVIEHVHTVDRPGASEPRGQVSPPSLEDLGGWLPGMHSRPPSPPMPPTMPHTARRTSRRLAMMSRMGGRGGRVGRRLSWAAWEGVAGPRQLHAHT